MSLSSANSAYALRLFLNAQVPGNTTLMFCQAFTEYFKNATLDGGAISPGTESLTHAAGALLSGITMAFKSEDKTLTCVLLQAAFMSYWSAKDPVTSEVAIKTMWPSCTPPAVIDEPLASFLIPALDKEGMESMEAQTAVAGAIFEWLTTAVKVEVSSSFYYFV